jgi:hypothetical protein
MLNLGNLELDAGEPARAIELLEQSSMRGAVQRLDRAAAWSRLPQLEATIALGRFDQSIECAAAARTVLERLHDAQGIKRLMALETRLQHETDGKYAAKPLLRADLQSSEQ